MLKNGFDQPEAIIVGGHYTAWQVAYAGKPQSGKEYADTEDAALDAGKAKIAELCAVHCGHPCYLYPDPSLWTVRIFD